MQFRNILILFLVGAALAASTGACSSSKDDRSESSVRASAEERNEIKAILDGIGAQTFLTEIDVVDFTLDGLNGESTTLSELAGQFVFLNFWATWCPYCREKMPSLEVLHNELRNEPFRIVAVNVQEDAATVESYIEEFGYTFPILLDSDGRVTTDYGVRGIPTTFFIAPDGTVLGVFSGPWSRDDADILDGMKRIMAIAAN